MLDDATTGETRFAEVIESEDELRAIVGTPGHRPANKVIDHIDAYCRTFIAASPFLVMASVDATGVVDVSPKGDPAGFVLVLDDRTLAIPDRPGNRRVDTFRNILANPALGLIFLIPGQGETLRVSGRARLVRDLWLREKMPVHGKVPELALVLEVERVLFHCSKAMLRSSLWKPEGWPDRTDVPSIAQAVIAHAKLNETEAEVEMVVQASYRELY